MEDVLLCTSTCAPVQCWTVCKCLKLVQVRMYGNVHVMCHTLCVHIKWCKCLHDSTWYCACICQYDNACVCKCMYLVLCSFQPPARQHWSLWCGQSTNGVSSNLNLVLLWTIFMCFIRSHSELKYVRQPSHCLPMLHWSLWCGQPTLCLLITSYAIMMMVISITVTWYVHVSCS